MKGERGAIPLVKLVLYTGDEIVRRLATVLSPNTSSSELTDTLRGFFVEQDTAPSGRIIYMQLLICILLFLLF